MAGVGKLITRDLLTAFFRLDSYLSNCIVFFLRGAWYGWVLWDMCGVLSIGACRTFLWTNINPLARSLRRLLRTIATLTALSLLPEATHYVNEGHTKTLTRKGTMARFEC